MERTNPRWTIFDVIGREDVCIIVTGGLDGVDIHLYKSTPIVPDNSFSKKSFKSLQWLVATSFQLPVLMEVITPDTSTNIKFG